jgi:hypothetical protein
MRKLPKILRYSLYALLSIVCLSCAKAVPIIGGEKPFIVSEICKYNETHSKYTAESSGSGVFNGNHEGYPQIVLRTGLYQISDTITWCSNNR